MGITDAKVLEEGSIEGEEGAGAVIRAVGTDVREDLSRVHVHGISQTF